MERELSGYEIFENMMWECYKIFVTEACDKEDVDLNNINKILLKLQKKMSKHNGLEWSSPGRIITKKLNFNKKYDDFIYKELEDAFYKVYMTYMLIAGGEPMDYCDVDEMLLGLQIKIYEHHNLTLSKEIKSILEGGENGR